ncbi:hypothetical protein BDZ45DRAFT_750151 [Acephala macrosclerotiorum]|nr:hypothetical protein BDZ45DRAFT_750151 [Acephala macrosclerotiorum]
MVLSDVYFRPCHLFRHGYDLRLSPEIDEPDSPGSEEHYHTQPQDYYAIWALSAVNYQIPSGLGRAFWSHAHIDVYRGPDSLIDPLDHRPSVHSGIKKIGVILSYEELIALGNSLKWIRVFKEMDVKRVRVNLMLSFSDPDSDSEAIEIIRPESSIDSSDG